MRSCSLTPYEFVEIALEELLQIPLQILFRYGPACGQQVPVLAPEHLADHRPGVVPLLNQVLQNPGIGVLGDKRETQCL